MSMSLADRRGLAPGPASTMCTSFLAYPMLNGMGPESLSIPLQRPNISGLPTISCERIADDPRPPTPSRTLTTHAQKPSIVIEQATSSYSFRFSELSQPILKFFLLAFL
jgi:hypothetical protein